MKRTVLHIFLLLSAFTAYSQSSTLDSLKALIENATSDTTRIKFEIRYASELTYSNGEESKRLLEDCISQSKKIRFKQGEAAAIFSLAVPYAIEGKYEVSLKLMIQASAIYQQLNDNNGYAKCIGGQGNIYYFMDELPKAQEYYEKALALYKKEDNSIGMASCISNLGLICHKTKNFNKGLEYQLEGLKLEEKADNKRGIAISHISISALLIDLKKFDEAKRHALLAIRFSKSIADTNGTSDGMLRLADCYRLSGQTDSAQHYLNETIRICAKIKDLFQLKYALETQIELFDSLGLYYNAYKSQGWLMSIKDSLLTKEKTAQLIEMQTKFDTKQKEKENEILISKNFNQKLMLYGLVLIIVLAFSLTLQIFLSSKKLRVSHEKLLIYNQEVNQQKEEIETQTESLINANEAIIAQRDQIENTHQKISDSIVYASFIQAAMLPTEESLNSISSEIFILYKPRDIVSGDFYWFKEKNGNYLLAVADCTGHGVPGALLSMMGISFLNDIVANSTNIKTSSILEDLRHNVKLALGQFSNKSLRKEGIEIGIINYNPIQKMLSFSGAYLSLWLCRKGQLKEYKSDRMSIGISLKEKPFSNIDINIETGDIVYMFTDGFADQLGGPNRKKLLRRNLIQEITSISHLPLLEQKNYLEKIHQTWKGDKFDQIDDILVMGIKF